MKRGILLVIIGMATLFGTNPLWSQESASFLTDPSIQQHSIEYPTGSSANRNGIFGYCVNLRDPIRGVYTFPVPAFTPLTFIGNPTVSSTYGGELGSGDIYYAVSDDDILRTISMADGSETIIAPVTGLIADETIITDMAYHGPTNTMYMCSAYNLYTLNTSTGEATFIGPIVTGGELIICIGINCAGDMYGIEILNDNLLSINTSTGAGTVIGPTNYPANFAQGCDFDNSTGILYWAAYSGNGVSGIRTVDLVTGNTTEVIPTTDYELDAFVIVGSCGQLVIPVSNWAMIIGIFLILAIAVIRFRKLV